MVLRADDRGARTRIIVIAGAVACVALGASLMHSGGRPAPRIVPAAVLTSGSGFGLSGTIGNLTPGITSRLILRVTNRTIRAITLKTVTIRVPVIPVGCPVANLTIDGKDLAGSPPAVTITGLNAKVPARARAKVPLRVHLARSASNGCQHARFPLRYSGSATSGHPRRATVTQLTSFPDPSAVGQPVVFFATVRAHSLKRSRPTGRVTFYRCTDPHPLQARPLRRAEGQCLLAGLRSSATADRHS